MSEEVLFTSISLAVTCLLLQLRRFFVRVGRSRTKFAHVSPTEPDNSLHDSRVEGFLDEWPSEITVPADFFARRSL